MVVAPVPSRSATPDCGARHHPCAPLVLRVVGGVRSAVPVLWPDAASAGARPGV